MNLASEYVKKVAAEVVAELRAESQKDWLLSTKVLDDARQVIDTALQTEVGPSLKMFVRLYVAARMIHQDAVLEGSGATERVMDALQLDDDPASTSTSIVEMVEQSVAGSESQPGTVFHLGDVDVITPAKEVTEFPLAPGYKVLKDGGRIRPGEVMSKHIRIEQGEFKSELYFDISSGEPDLPVKAVGFLDGEAGDESFYFAFIIDGRGRPWFDNQGSLRRSLSGPYQGGPLGLVSRIQFLHAARKHPDRDLFSSLLDRR